MSQSTANIQPGGKLQGEQLFQSIVESAEFGLCVTGEEGKILYANPALCSMLGYGARELNGQHFSILTSSSQTAKEWESIYQQSIHEQVAFPGEYQVRRKEGDLLDVVISASTHVGPEGKPRQISFFQDITDQKVAAKALQES